jgi:hypothetical protein
MQNDDYKIRGNTQNLISIREMKKVLNDWIRKLLPIEQKHSQRQIQKMESNNAYPANSDAIFLGCKES